MRAEQLRRTLRILLILHENKYLAMEIPGRTMYFYVEKERKKEENKIFV